MKIIFGIFLITCLCIVTILGTITLSSAKSGNEDEQLIKVGVGAFRDGFYDIAEKQFLTFIDTFPKHNNILDIYYLLGKTLTIHGKLKEAKTAFSIIITAGKSFENMDQALLCMAELEIRLGNREEARKYLQSIIKKYPKFDRIDFSYFLLGVLELGTNQRTGSESFFKKVTQLSKNNDLIYISYFWLGLQSFKEKQFEIAAEYFRTILNHPEFIPAEYLKYTLFWLGETSLRLDRTGEALSNFDAIYTRFNHGPLIPYVFWKIGFCEYQSGNLTKAIETYQSFKNKFIDSPLLPSVHYLLGYLFMIKGDYPSSIKELKFIYNPSRGEPGESISLLALYWNYIHQGDFEEATRVSQRLQKSNYSEDDKFFIQWLNAEFLYASGNLQESLPYYFNILDSPFREECLYRIGKAYYFQNKYRESITNFDILFLEFPNSKYLPEGLFIKGECLVKLGVLDQSLDTYSALIRQNQNNLWSLFALTQMGHLYLSNNNPNQCEKLYLILLKNFPDQPLSYYAALKLGTLYLYQNNISKALYYYAIVLKGKYPDLSGEAYFGLGEVFYHQKKYDKALRSFGEILKDRQENTPWYYLAHLEVGNLKKRAGEIEEAKYSYSIVLNQSKDEEMKQAAKKLLEGLNLH